MDEREQLRHLYKGEAWTQVVELQATAVRAGYDPRILVASAGLGLRSIDDVAPAYAATFSRGHPDSVGATSAESRQWWARLGDLHDAAQLRKVAASGETMLVLSEAYADALADDLASIAASIAASTRSAPVLLVGGSRDVLGLIRLPADGELRTTLSGSTGSLTLRMAQRWLDLREGGPVVDEEAMVRWKKWAASAKEEDPPVKYDRTSQSDAQVRTWIETVRTTDPNIACTRALRQLRDAGFACEQNRFKTLFHESRGVVA